MSSQNSVSLTFIRKGNAKASLPTNMHRKRSVVLGNNVGSGVLKPFYCTRTPNVESYKTLLSESIMINSFFALTNTLLKNLL